MKKILQQIKNAFKSEEKNDDQKDMVNHLFRLIFNEKDTVSSINTFKELKRKVDNEIAKRGIESLIVHTECEDYFDNHKNEILIKTK